MTNDDELHPTYRYGGLEDNPGVRDLVEDMKRLRDDYGDVVEAVAVSVRTSEGLLRLSLGELLTLERGDWAMIVNPS